MGLISCKTHFATRYIWDVTDEGFISRKELYILRLPGGEREKGGGQRNTPERPQGGGLQEGNPKL